MNTRQKLVFGVVSVLGVLIAISAHLAGRYGISIAASGITVAFVIYARRGSKR